MSAIHIANAIAASNPVCPVDVFKLRAWARSRLCAEGLLDFHEAVDKLAADADRDGIDVDQAQAIMAAEFGAVR